MKHSLLHWAVPAVLAGVFCLTACSKTAKPDKSDAPPRYSVALADIVSPVELVTNGAGKIEVRFTLSNARAEELFKFAMKNARAPEMEILVGSTAITKPGMSSELAISNGMVRVFSPLSDSSEIRAIGESLKSQQSGGSQNLEKPQNKLER